MELEYRKFEVEHMRLISPDTYNERDIGLFLTDAYRHLLEDSFAISAWDGVRCIGAAGLYNVFPGRKSMAWALISKDAGHNMLSIVRTIRRKLDSEQVDRIEMLVLSEFKAGHKFAKLLGFECETPKGMRKHSPQGEDEHLYARVK